jgi:hypothetical protein
MQVQDSTPGVAALGLRVDGARLWDSLMRLAQIGATAKGGVCRLALTERDRGRATCSSDGRRRSAARCASMRSATSLRAARVRATTCRP